MRQVLSRQVLGKGMLTAAAASSLLSIATGAAYAHPGAMAEAAHSPGVLSGNSVSVPITFAPNVCGNSVDGGAALNPAMGNTCATTTGSHVSRDAYEHYLGPERAEAFERYLDEERRGRHALPDRRAEEDGGHGEERGYGEQHHPAPRHAAPRHEAPRHAAPRHEERHAGSGYGDSAQECDDHPRHEAEHPHPAPPAPPRAAPRPAPERPAPRPHPKPAPAPETPAPAPVAQAPMPLPAPEPFPTPAEEAPAPLPAPAPVEEAPPVTLPAPAPPVEQELPAPRPPHGSQPVGHPAPAPAPEVVRP
ncbi:chaplin, partial [Streptomyces goshikiensis]